MKQINISFILLALLFAPRGVSAASPQENLVFTARMDGQQEVPQVSTPGRGLAAAILSPLHDTLCITASWVGLTGPPTSAHVHIGLPGESGPPVIDLTPFLSDSGLQLGATITGAQLTPQIIGNLLAGRYYINLHTEQHITGEIRGQLLLEAEETYVSRLDGQQETPPNGSIGRGLGVFHISADETSIRFRILVRDMTGPTANAHLHNAPPGEAGPPVVDLMPFLVAGGIYFVGTLDTSLFVDYDIFLAELRAGNIYVNIHTDSFPNGELRGQLMRERSVGFEALLNPEQEVPPTASSGLGLAYFSLNPGADTLRFEAVMGGLSASPTSAHLHFAPPGVSGPIEVDLTLGLQGNGMLGTVADTTVNHDLLRKMLRGDIYVNVHNANFPDGEIRGQLIPSARAVYTILLNGGQVAPVVNGDGYGFGFVAIDPLQDIGRYSFLYGGLSGASTGVNFHYGPAGASGPLFYTVTPFVTNDNYGTGYWFANDTLTPLLPGLAGTLANDSVYLNVQTAANPSGEIRGQVLGGLVCNTFVTDTTLAAHSVIDYNRELNVYPNPAGADGIVTARYVSGSSSNAVLTVFDMLGKKLAESHVNALVGTNEYKLDLANYGRGIYTIKLTVGSNVYTQRVSFN